MKDENYFFGDSEFHNPALKIENSEKLGKIHQIVDQYKLNKHQVNKIRNVFEEEMKNGLSSDQTRKGCLQCENTFVTDLPTGDEKGDYLSLDLGSTNFRVLLSRLKGRNEEAQFIVKYYDIPLEIKVGQSQKLFEHIANCIDDFLNDVPELREVHLPLGFTFSFPMVQKAINIGLLVTWTKCYDLPDVINKNAVEFLQEALNKKNLNVDVVAILNDTTGTLVKGAYSHPDCCIGLILGSGFNACYVEKAERIEKWHDEKHENVKNVLIDIECGAFGDDGCIDFIKTEEDFEIDKESLFPGSFTFEKMFSGTFVGDIVRRILLKLTSKGLLFEGKVTEKLKEKTSVTSAQVSLIDNENKDCVETRKLVADLGYEKYEEDDLRIIEYVCAVVSVRGALLVSILMAYLLDYIDRENATIAIDGSLFAHPKYKTLMTDFISALSNGKKFKLVSAKDGSGKGAGLVAAIAERLRTRK
ncbi:hexokinase-1-like isoform X1 [Dinothrombium tinctorium]|uniref:Phosphotransferase n=1 Tax=Dinothrombium tinctorium TaxID=1965070 RepID=A0A3S3NUM9_9ACAR|nr:hexokinase-1-like isoform X1 [Dinothrombium tinctorium]